MLDFLLTGGTIIDGSGNVGYRAGLGIESNSICVIPGSASGIEAREILGVDGCVVCPGFIDVHTHSDLAALADPLDEPKVRQGVTTDFIGLDGMGYAPLSSDNLKRMLRIWAGISGYPELDYDWNTVAEYLERYRHATATNTGFFVPNACLRAEVVGWENRPATQSEIRRMQQLLRQGIEEGALGLSTGLTYPPGSYATKDELVELCKTVSRYGGVYVTHVRYDLGDGAFDGFLEAIDIGALSDCPVHISHYATNLAIRGKADEMLRIVDYARRRGVDLTFDSYPWPAGSSYLSAVLPQWAQNGGPSRLVKCLNDPEMRTKMRHAAPALVGAPDKLVISAVRSASNQWCEGLSVEQIAHSLGKDPMDTICDLLVEEDLQVAFYTFTGDMDDVETIMLHPAQMVCSDGLRIGGKPNPRTYGTYPKILGELVRDKAIMPLEQAVRKMTSFPSQRFSLSDRGLLRDGMAADVVVFEPSTVGSTATFEDPKQYPIGIQYVFVNGVKVVHNGRHTSKTPGTSMRQGRIER